MKALVTERVGKGVAFMPFHFGGFCQGEDRRGITRRAPTRSCSARASTRITTYGYDPVTFMQETKVHALPDPAA